MSGSVELRAVYRLQLTPQFGFAAARQLIPYLRDLGISHLYLSPSLQARPGSLHGYDVIDPTRLSADLGGESEFRRLAAEADGAGMGILLDIVPNHMASAAENRYWADPALREKFFDIDPVSGRHRRFFDVDELAGVRQEDPEVFEETHRLVLSLVREGVVDGLRIDHPDGLADPAEYLARLRRGGAEQVWVEKILESEEQLRDWPVSGTVGYEFLNDVCGLFLESAGEAPLSALWERIAGDSRPFAEFAGAAKREQVSGTFTPEVDRLGRVLEPAGLEGSEREALTEALTSLSIYRTYVVPETGEIGADDREQIEAAGMDPGIAGRLLLGEPAPAEFVVRFQQTTPALTAKGIEDTAFYRYGRLLALNDVGGDPGRFGIDVRRFHAGNAERAARFPFGLLTTATHDTKRSGDVRARIAAIAGDATEWTATVERWLTGTRGWRSGGAPDDVERYFIFQTLVGAWPVSEERLHQYLEKALREAKRNTSWVDQNQEWEDAVHGFCRRLIADSEFVGQLEAYIARLRPAAERAALGSLVLKLTCPGVPDIYQGDELELLALVDPDNRRPVDWRWYEAMLARLLGGAPVTRETQKLWLTARLLGLRARRPEPFTGSYDPIDAGPAVCAFTRGGALLVAVAVRGELAGASLEPPTGRWRDVLRGGETDFRGPVEAGPLLDEHGLAVFERVGE